jgi:hypothetical protein
MTKKSKFDSRQRQEILLHKVQTGSGARPASYTMGMEDKAAGALKLITHFRLVPMSRMVELYFHSPILLHGMMLN